jgi:hypothetical protein
LAAGSDDIFVSPRDGRRNRPYDGDGSLRGDHRDWSARRGGRRTGFIIVAILLIVGLAGGITYYLYGNAFLGLIGLSSRGSTTKSESSTVASASTAPDIRIVFSGKTTDLQAASGNVIQQDPSDAATTWIRSSVQMAHSNGTTEGAYVSIPEKSLVGLVGRRVLVTVTAASGAKGELPPFAVAYSADTSGNSGWRVFTPTTTFQDYTFPYVIPQRYSERQYIGVWSDIAGRGAPLAVRQITIRAAR